MDSWLVLLNYLHCYSCYHFWYCCCSWCVAGGVVDCLDGVASVCLCVCLSACHQHRSFPRNSSTLCPGHTSGVTCWWVESTSRPGWLTYCLLGAYVLACWLVCFCMCLSICLSVCCLSLSLGLSAFLSLCLSVSVSLSLTWVEVLFSLMSHVSHCLCSLCCAQGDVVMDLADLHMMVQYEGGTWSIEHVLERLRLFLRLSLSHSCSLYLSECDTHEFSCSFSCSLSVSLCLSPSVSVCLRLQPPAPRRAPLLAHVRTGFLWARATRTASLLVSYMSSRIQSSRVSGSRHCHCPCCHTHALTTVSFHSISVMCVTVACPLPFSLTGPAARSLLAEASACILSMMS